MKDGRLQSAARTQQSERLQPDNVAGRCAGDPARRTGGIAIDADGGVYTHSGPHAGAEAGGALSVEESAVGERREFTQAGFIDGEEVDALARRRSATEVHWPMRRVSVPG